jgi:hypothetical protein
MKCFRPVSLKYFKIIILSFISFIVSVLFVFIWTLICVILSIVSLFHFNWKCWEDFGENVTDWIWKWDDGGF